MMSINNDTIYDIFMDVLQETNPELSIFINSMKDQTSNNNQVKTFEDCKEIELDIIKRLDNANPFK